MSFRDYARALDRRWREGLRASASPDLIILRSVPSTHLLGRRIAEEYGRENLVPPSADLIAWEQTSGIGREGRRWSSPAGKGIYLTSIRAMTRMAGPRMAGPRVAGPREAGPEPERIQMLPLSAAVEICEALNRLLAGEALPDGEGCRLKWPNDIQVAGRKLGGILIDVLGSGASAPPRRPSESEPSAVAERRSRRDRTAIVVLSVGVNLAENREAFGEARATSIDFEAARWDRGPLAAAEVAGELASAISRAVGGERPAGELVARYRQLSLHRPGEAMRCRIDSKLVDGIFEGFDRFGFLELRVDGELERISSGVIVDGA